MRKNSGRLLLCSALLAGPLGATACSDSGAPEPASPTAPATTTAPPAPLAAEPEPVEPAPLSGADLVARGKQVYNSNCIACHNPDPTQPGALGPDIAGSAFELVQGKVLRNEYPTGYTPKRETGAMIPLPHLEKDIAAIVAYLDDTAK